MGLINDCLDSSLEKELADLLKPFTQESDYISDPWRAEPVFDYVACIRRVVDSLSRAQDSNREIACGHTKSDLWKEQHANAKEYCTVCRLHQHIEDAQAETDKWRTAVEDALGLEHDKENHTPEWAHDIILQIREIGNRK
jgi:hypothetical protein